MKVGRTSPPATSNPAKRTAAKAGHESRLPSRGPGARGRPLSFQPPLPSSSPSSLWGVGRVGNHARRRHLEGRTRRAARGGPRLPVRRPPTGSFPRRAGEGVAGPPPFSSSFRDGASGRIGVGRSGAPSEWGRRDPPPPDVARGRRRRRPRTPGRDKRSGSPGGGVSRAGSRPYHNRVKLPLL